MKRAGKEFLAWASGRKCCVPGCGMMGELHHVRGVVSPKSGLPLAPRSGIAYVVVAPLCGAHHRTGPDSLHALGDDGFEREHGLRLGYLLGVATALLAEYALEVESERNPRSDG